MFGRTILIVEDESIVALDLEDTIRGLGYEISAVVSSGEAAVAAVAERCPDLVLMDVMFRGGGIDGIQAARNIQEHHDLPIIFLTAYADENTLLRAKAVAPFGYLLKPFEDHSLRAMIEVALHKHAAWLRLGEGERRLAGILDGLNEGILAADEAGLVAFMNREAEEMTGWKREAAMGQAASLVCPLAPEFLGDGEHPIMRVLADGQQAISELPVPVARRDGGSRAVIDMARPLTDGHNRVIGATLFLRDSAAAARPLALPRDDLTGLIGRQVFQERLGLALAGAAGRMGVLTINIDDLCGINSRHGRAGGDALLRATADRLRELCAAADLVARLEGDVFCLVQGGVGAEEVSNLAALLRDALAKPVEHGNRPMACTVSIGIVLAGADASPVQVLKMANAAVHRAKAEGGNTWCFFDGAIDLERRQRAKLALDLREALAGGDLDLVYQPILAVGEGGRPRGIEVMPRWRARRVAGAAVHEMAAPAGLSAELLEWMFATLPAQINVWRRRDFKPAFISTSIPSGLLPMAVAAVARQAWNVEAGAARLELAVGVHDVEAGEMVHLADLRQRGVALALNGIGTDCAAPACLRRLAPSRLKIAGEITAEPGAMAEVMAGLGRALAIPVAASGVDSQGQFDSLVGLGYAFLQGTFIGPPTEPDRLHDNSIARPRELPFMSVT